MGQSQSNEPVLTSKQPNSQTLKETHELSKLNTKIDGNTPPTTPILTSNYSCKVDSNKLSNQLEKQQKSNIDTLDASNIITAGYKGYLVRKQINRQQESTNIIKTVYKAYLIRKEMKRKVEAANKIKSIYKSNLVRKEMKRKVEAANKIKSLYKSNLVRETLKNKQVASNIIKSYLTTYQQKKKNKKASIINACIKGFSDRLYINELNYENILEEEKMASTIKGYILGRITRLNITQKILLINSIDIWKTRVYGNNLHKDSKNSKSKLCHKLTNLKYGFNNWRYHMNEINFIYNYLDRYYNFKLLKKYYKLWVSNYYNDYYNKIYTSLQIQTYYKKLMNEYQQLPKVNTVNIIKNWKINSEHYKKLNKLTHTNVEKQNIIDGWNTNMINEELKIDYFDNWYYYTDIYKLHLADIHRNLLFKKKTIQVWNNNSRYQKMKRRQYGLNIQKAYIQHIYNSLFDAFNIWKLKNNLYFSRLKY